MGAAVVLGASGCGSTGSPAGQPRDASLVRTEDGRWSEYETGIASWYGGKWHGRRTASGERYNQDSMTAAHKRLPFGSKVRVTNLRNGKSCVVQINNRGPHVRGRVIDLSVAAAKQIDAYQGGLTRVKVEVTR